MPRIATGSRLATTRATRTRSPTTTRTSKTGSNINANVLFQGQNWIALTAHNEYGFDVLSQVGGHFQSIINDPKQLMAAFRWHMLEDGLLKTGAAVGRGRPRSTMTTGANSMSAGNVGGTSAAAIATPRASARSRARVSRVSRLSGSNNSGGDQTGNT